MDLIFTNGSSRQQAQWRQALHSLLNLPFEKIPLTIEVSFVDPAELIGGGHTDLAQTSWTYGSSEATTKVRNDAPGFGTADASLKALAASMGLVYNADIHYNETAAHETGHALFAALPEESRIAIAQMFGAKGDGIEELSAGVRWEDRIIEGIADTFKEAFLPRRLRVFPNRTNRSIPYNKFPEFRQLFRDGIANITGKVEFEKDLLEALHTNLNGPKVSQWESRVTGLEQDIKEAQHFRYTYTIPRSWFPVVAVNPFTIYGYIQFALRLKNKATGDVLHFARGAWQLVNNTLEEVDSLLWSESGFDFIYNFPEPPNVPEAEDTSEGGTNHWQLYGEEAVADGGPTFTIDHSFTVPAGITVVVQAWAMISPQPFVTIPLDPTIAAEIKAALPHLIYQEGATPAGEPIDLPAAAMEPTGQARGAHPTKRPTAGHVH